MGKVVILAGSDDAEAIQAALDGSEIDFEVIEPTASNLLHIAIGMVDAESAEEPAPDAEEPAEEPAPDAEEPAEEPAPDAEVKEENLGSIVVNGETIDAVRVATIESTLFVGDFQAGPKTSYSLNESKFSFWINDERRPKHRSTVERAGYKTSIELHIKESKTGRPYLAVGTDLADLFMIK
jgi:hypothetical protein